MFDRPCPLGKAVCWQNCPYMKFGLTPDSLVSLTEKGENVAEGQDENTIRVLGLLQEHSPRLLRHICQITGNGFGITVERVKELRGLGLVWIPNITDVSECGYPYIGKVKAIPANLEVKRT